ncbi:hypothetical protein F4677DRAFT_255849 [Hypoxylon crocopeplum]|nr:hypothetical protein F4677DRAFT_255849 [Hypoxylon crocopeplum]
MLSTNHLLSQNPCSETRPKHPQVTQDICACAGEFTQSSQPSAYSPCSSSSLASLLSSPSSLSSLPSTYLARPESVWVSGTRKTSNTAPQSQMKRQSKISKASPTVPSSRLRQRTPIIDLPPTIYHLLSLLSLPNLLNLLHQHHTTNYKPRTTLSNAAIDSNPPRELNLPPAESISHTGSAYQALMPCPRVDATWAGAAAAAAAAVAAGDPYRPGSSMSSGSTMTTMTAITAPTSAATPNSNPTLTPIPTTATLSDRNSSRANENASIVTHELKVQSIEKEVLLRDSRDLMRQLLYGLEYLRRATGYVARDFSHITRIARAFLGYGPSENFLTAAECWVADPPPLVRGLCDEEGVEEEEEAEEQKEKEKEIKKQVREEKELRRKIYELRNRRGAFSVPGGTPLAVVKATAKVKKGPLHEALFGGGPWDQLMRKRNWELSQGQRAVYTPSCLALPSVEEEEMSEDGDGVEAKEEEEEEEEEDEELEVSVQLLTSAPNYTHSLSLSLSVIIIVIAITCVKLSMLTSQMIYIPENNPPAEEIQIFEDENFDWMVLEDPRDLH